MSSRENALRVLLLPDMVCRMKVSDSGTLACVIFQSSFCLWRQTCLAPHPILRTITLLTIGPCHTQSACVFVNESSWHLQVTLYPGLPPSGGLALISFWVAPVSHPQTHPKKRGHSELSLLCFSPQATPTLLLSL